MGDFSEGAPCWADATVLDLPAAKRFYAELLGWSFEEGSPEFGGYAQASVDGKAVAALAPQMAGQEAPPAWTLYFASPNVAATADKVREHGGRVLLEPMEIGEFGRMLLAADPGGVLFGVWEAGRHHGFERTMDPGSFCWAEIVTRDPAAADAFFPAVFPFDVKKMAGPPEADYHVWSIGGSPVIGRMRMPGDAPEQTPPHSEIYFAVRDCDTVVADVMRLGGLVVDGPTDSPFGRFAAVADPQGVRFSVIDTSHTRGEVPSLS
ncbi:VOC family protein [Streptomyces litchfieldiae]|uniref:VOC family protein n=1 Tax=Streptomyces litchfieldiae TaxID=3075543 RepID=A0ABU2MK64_9ACTN|nr:VOC family protein [Streptomyces sp. DSM 44938]MDT0341832.1 VOC family protein [Streptomyces sp. DSM 44938]